MTLTRAGGAAPENRSTAEPDADNGANQSEVTAGARMVGPALFVDPQSRTLARLLERIAPTDVPVLIAGETGTGKERLARHIHERSGRTGRFVAVQCGQLTHRELTGPDQGTSAVTAGPWDRGTVFYDDVGDLSPSHQCELLRTLRANESAPRAVAGNVALPRVRIIAATSTDLGEAAAAGRFRRDLLYRLNLAAIKVLPLRQRPGDIVPLANHFLQLHSDTGRLPHRVLGDDATSRLRRYRWPGNVRELENVIRFALLTASHRELGVEDLEIEDDPSAGPVADAAASNNPPESTRDKLAALFSQLMSQNPGTQLFDDIEGLLVTEAFRATGANQVHTATLLGISRNVVRTLLQKHGLLKPRGRPRT